MYKMDRFLLITARMGRLSLRRLYEQTKATQLTPLRSIQARVEAQHSLTLWNESSMKVIRGLLL